MPAPREPVSSLYLHFPFCEAKCHYCDFYSIGREKTRAGDPDLFERSLIREIRIRGDRGEFAPEFRTLFLGGGTPSMTEPASMERIFKVLFEYTRPAPEVEWTMEANPSSIGLERFRDFRSLGVNRISMGVQSLRPDHLAKLGRVHSESDALRALEEVFQAGFSRVSTDLLCGVPGQSVADLQSHMQRLTAFPLTHLSLYLLTLTPGNPLYSELPEEEEQLSHLLCIDRFMTDLGFEHYEISNFAKPGHRARHNLVYWSGGSYLGLGPSAHSFLRERGIRFKNPNSLHRWSTALLEKGEIPLEGEEVLTPTQRDLERWMLALRLEEGFPREWLDTPRRKSKADLLHREGLLEPHPTLSGRFRATARGFALSDALIRELS
jgi:oxygen-independent coproporphyrinogen-3 oxidase